MATLPADNYVNDNARTEGEMKDAFEDFRDIFAQMLGGGSPAEALTISSGAITPTRGLVIVTAQSGGVDDLDSVSVANLPEGSLILISGGTDTITLKNGSGTGALLNGTRGDVLLGGNSWDQALYRRFSDFWVLSYVYRNDPVYGRSDLGLGNAAVATTGSGNGLDADTVDGSHASAFLGATATAADSTELLGINGANYTRKDAAAGTQVQSNLERHDFGQFTIRDNTGLNPRVYLEASSVRRGRLDWAADEIRLFGYASDGTTLTGGFQARDNDALPQYWSETPAAWRTLAPVSSVNAASSSVGRFRVQHPAGSRTDAIWWEKISTITMPANLPTGETNIKCLLKFYAHLSASDNVAWSIHLGANNDETDTVVCQGISGVFEPAFDYRVNDGGLGYDSRLDGHEITWNTGGHFLTLMLRNVTGGGGTTSWNLGFMSVDIYPAAGFLNDTI